MKELLRGFVLLLLAAIVLGVVIPGALFVIRLANSWTSRNTDQLLGGALAICGGGLMLVAAMIGAGAFARLAGWKPPRRDDPQPPAIDAYYQPLPPPAAPPPWGMTGGNNFQLLPPIESGQDARFSFQINQPRNEGDREQ